VTYACSGLVCRNRVSSPGLFCGSCEPPAVSDPPRTTPTGESLRAIRFQILNSAYKLALGHAAEQASALEHLALLVNTLIKEPNQ
jgi:hypothetical protein